MSRNKKPERAVAWHVCSISTRQFSPLALVDNAFLSRETLTGLASPLKKCIHGRASNHFCPADVSIFMSIYELGENFRKANGQ